MKEINAKIQVRFCDLDAYGHVNHAMYLSYMEVARVELVRDIFVRDMKRNIQYLLIGAHVQYIKPVLLDDTLIVTARFLEAGKVKFRVDYELRNGSGTLCATGYTEHALYDGKAGRPIRITDELRDFINGQG
ncbi:MAG: acyl-CoA thioesterase [Deferribacteraceae bacterium]|jgi:acyl-CoA thioester hydrolase|nr:acyl-CoA thioesterase [Deferribacteraceae bacterium]